MTPQQKAMADLLHISLIKWADTTHDQLEKLRDLGYDDKKVDKLSHDVESTIDAIIADADNEVVNMKMIDTIHGHIEKMKKVLP